MNTDQRGTVIVTFMVVGTLMLPLGLWWLLGFGGFLMSVGICSFLWGGLGLARI
jgi:hypothetical protein